jgi:hypothetical protein
MHLLSEKKHLVEPVQQWVGKHGVFLPEELSTGGS